MSRNLSFFGMLLASVYILMNFTQKSQVIEAVSVKLIPPECFLGLQCWSFSKDTHLHCPRQWPKWQARYHSVLVKSQVSSQTELTLTQTPDFSLGKAQRMLGKFYLPTRKLRFRKVSISI
jgi:hypothetical protein